MSLIYDITAPKKTANISINGDLIQKAESFNINLSKTLEHELDRIVRKKMEEEWIEETREAADEYNIHIRNNGAFGDTIRRF